MDLCISRISFQQTRVSEVKNRHDQNGEYPRCKTSTWENKTQWANKLSMEKKAELPVQLVTGRMMMMMMTIMTMMIDRE